MSKNEYWTEFWKKHGECTKSSHAQVQVLRTLNKRPIDESVWDETLSFINEKLDLKKGDDVLDLCCGNGLISKFIASKETQVTAVDVSKDLVSNLEDYENITPITSDIRLLDFKANSFDKVLVYAGIQYLSESESIILLEQIFNWLKPNGVLFIGDIPDKSRLWNFYNSSERRQVYINNLKNHTPVVGNWFSSEFFNAVGETLGFNSSESYTQPENQIYSNFRFDHRFSK